MTLALAALLALQDPEVATVTLDVQDMPLPKLMELFTKATGIPIELDDAVKKELDDKELISFKVEKLQALGAARLLFGPRGYDVKAVDKKKIRVSKP